MLQNETLQIFLQPGTHVELRAFRVSLIPWPRVKGFQSISDSTAVGQYSKRGRRRRKIV